MIERQRIIVDANEAVADVAYRAHEVIAIYPITPASPMGEHADAWAAENRPNIWGAVPRVVEMQSEAGAAGTVHGALQAGSLSTTFTASQGLLLMLPNMFKIAGELTPAVIHVASRTLATHALSIFGDHSDVYAARATGFAQLAASSVQEAHDLALISQAATLKSRIPFLHFFDGFRTSHEIARIDRLSDEDLTAMLDEDLIRAHRERALSPDHPVIRGTAQNPDTWFQAREAVNPYYDACPGIVQETMDRFARLTGRQYHLFEYSGDPEAERVIVIMGSGAETVAETVDWGVARGQKIGVLKVRLLRPFSIQALIEALPASVRKIAVLDRAKEAGGAGEPLYQDILTALCETRQNGQSHLAHDPVVVGGRYGLSSKEFTPAMVKGVFDELGRPRPRNHFTVGIVDDVTHTSLHWDPEFDLEPEDVVRAVFFGLGADGTVGANKNSIKIIGEDTDNFVQGYFVYDSKKSGARTVSHLRFSPRPIRSPYLIRHASFVACHQWGFLDRYDMLEYAAPQAVFLLNAPYASSVVWDRLPREVQQTILEKRLKFYVIDALQVARELGMGSRINTIMQTCFFAISGVLPREQAIASIKHSIEKSYGKKGAEIVEMNFRAVDQTLEHLYRVDVPDRITATRSMPPIVSELAPDFVQRVTAVLLADKGDCLPVSAFPVDGTWMSGTTKWEKRDIAVEIPVWDSTICIQCNKCALVCPHAAIRVKTYPLEEVVAAPPTFKSVPFKGPDKGQAYTVQVAPEDCTGCSLCVQFCPVKDKSNPRHKAIDMAPQPPLREAERTNYAFFLDLPEADRASLKHNVKDSQFLEPLFEYSGACAGCGETPYIKLVTQLYGDRALIANATGCTSIYGGNLPSTPYTVNRDGRGPAWANSLFEDNAEFGLGFRLAVDRHQAQARALLPGMAGLLGEELVKGLLESGHAGEADIAEQRARVLVLRKRLAGIDSREARRLETLVDYLVRKSVWIFGGDGWAYDIGYGGLDHVLASGEDVNILVLDTEVYSNTGGQQSKSTPLGAVAKFAAAGKSVAKKDLGMLAMAYGHVYVARVAMGAKDAQTVKALQEAESYPGTSLVIAYSHCIAHGYDMAHGLEQQALAVEAGHWPLFRFDPRRTEAGENPLQLDSAPPRIPLSTYAYNEARYRMLLNSDPERAKELMTRAGADVRQRYAQYERLAGVPEDSGKKT